MPRAKIGEVMAMLKATHAQEDREAAEKKPVDADGLAQFLPDTWKAADAAEPNPA